ncbi:MAG: 4Fe-4S binding protein [Pseudomonadota bacterium]
MSGTVYDRMREFLDQFPLGFPATESGVELDILRRLFTPEEAEAAMLLTPFPEEASQIAGRSGTEAGELSELLESMSGKGLIFRTRRGDTTLYNTVPFMIGLYEYSVEKMDADLARLFKDYYDIAYQGEMAASRVPGFKVLPVARGFAAGTVLLPYPALEQEIAKARKIAVAECVCRKESRLLGEDCGHPRETCLSFGVAAEYYIDNGMGREVTVAEALAILEAADRSGLVHAGANTIHLSNVCNCCPCCCASMKGIAKKGHDRSLYLNALYEAVVDEETCVACGVCGDRCPVEAISVGEAARVDRARCLGCGLCATACEPGAITLIPRADRREPFHRMLDLGLAILQGKQENR